MLDNCSARRSARRLICSISPYPASSPSRPGGVREGRGSSTEGQELLALGGAQPLRPRHHILEQKALQQRRGRRLVRSRCVLCFDLPFGAPGKPPLATEQIAVGQRFMRQIFRSPSH
jgi:hypothetical protein